jgi:hypothetical protein
MVWNAKYWYNPNLFKASLSIQRLSGRRREQVAILLVAFRSAYPPVQKDLPDPLPLLLRIHSEIIKIYAGRGSC